MDCLKGSAATDFENALKDFTAAVAIDPDNVKCYTMLGNVYYAMKDYVQALINYNKVLALDPDNFYVFTYAQRAKHIKKYSDKIQKLNKSDRMFYDTNYRNGRAAGALALTFLLLGVMIFFGFLFMGSGIAGKGDADVELNWPFISVFIPLSKT